MRFNERAVTRDDAGFLFQVYLDVRREELASLGWGAQQTLEFAQLQHEIEQRRYAQRYPSAEHGILLVDGVCAGQWRVQRGRRELVLVDIALLERFRGRGIGAACLRALSREAASRSLRLRVRRDERAYTFCRRLGFVHLGPEPLGVFAARRTFLQHVQVANDH